MNIDEKLALLQGLFLQRAAVEDQIKELLGEAPEEDDEDSEEEEPVVKRRIAKRKPGRYNKGNPMPEEVKEEIHAKSADGVTSAELAREYGTSVSTIFKVLKTLPNRQTTKNNEVHGYVCENGHEFNSKLQPGFVICPVCHSDECQLGTLNGAVSEEDEE